MTAASMPAITCPPVEAALVTAGVQTMVTFDPLWAARARRLLLSPGTRVAVHASAAAPLRAPHGWTLNKATAGWWLCPERGGDDIRVPLGAVSGSAVSAGVVPVVDGANIPDARHLYVHPTGTLLDWLPGVGGVRMDDQLAFVDATPGRWALLLDAAAPTTTRCPWCWDSVDNPDCPVCDDDGTCDPVPAKGRSAVPWHWTPDTKDDTHA